MAIHGRHIFPTLQAKFGDLQYQMLFLGQETHHKYIFFGQYFQQNYQIIALLHLM